MKSKSNLVVVFAILTVVAAIWAMPTPAYGQIFLSQANQGRIAEYTTSGALVNPSLITGLNAPNNITASGGNLFISLINTGTIAEYTTSGATVNRSLITGMNSPAGVAVSGGNLFAVDEGLGTVGEYTMSGAPVNTSLITGLVSANGIAVSGSNLFVTTGNTVAEYTTSGALVNAALFPSSNSFYPFDVAVSGSNLFVVGTFYTSSPFTISGRLSEYTTSGAPVNIPLAVLSQNSFYVVASGSNLFVNNGFGTIGEYDATTGAEVNASLITGFPEIAGLAVVVPEPSTWMLLVTGASALLIFRRRAPRFEPSCTQAPPHDRETLMKFTTIRRTCSRSAALALFGLLAAFAANARAVTIAWSPVGNPGNAADPATGSLYGAVGYSYNIGTYDVTNSQYVEFLNAKDTAGLNTLGLYNSNMSSAVTYGGINFAPGAANGSKYSVISGDGNHPVNNVTWDDTIRFANWLNNGQGNGDTETGAYTLLGDTPTPTNGLSITRNAGATVFLPSENEWYKAAYYNPATSSYFQYPTSSNTTPTASSPTALPNHANFSPSGGGPGNLTDVGAYSGTTSPYGAFDMGGNVFQWNETLTFGSYWGLRGDSFAHDYSDPLLSSYRGVLSPADEALFVGFRVASVAPEPSTGVLAVIACGMMWWCRKRFKYS